MVDPFRGGTGPDPTLAGVIKELVVNCRRQLGATTLSITHDMASARKIANRIAVIFDGKIIWSGAVDESDESGNAHVEQFFNGHAGGSIQMQISRL